MKLLQEEQALLLLVLSSVPLSHSKQCVLLHKVQWLKVEEQDLHLLSAESK
jgi:hypothetical protein